LWEETYVRIGAISGSLRKESYNTKLLKAVAGLLTAAGHTVEFIDWSALPVLSEDLEGPNGPPEAVKAFRSQLGSYDFLLISTPEYNHSIPGGLKNAIDWASRAPNVWGGKRVAIMGATVGAWGAVQAVREVRHVLGVLGAQVQTHPMVNLPGAAQAFDGDGKLTNALALAAAEKLVASLG
jgi:chromate reductase